MCTFCVCIYIHTDIYEHIFAYMGNLGVLNLKGNKIVSYRNRRFSILLYSNFLFGMVKCVLVRLNYLKYCFHHGNLFLPQNQKQRLE